MVKWIMSRPVLMKKVGFFDLLTCYDERSLKIEAVEEKMLPKVRGL